MTYTLTLADGNTKTYQRLHDATERANKVAKDETREVQVRHDETDTVVHVATYVSGRYFHPFERVETPKHPAPSFEGFVPAYTRKRIQATVYRATEEKGKWLVFDGRTGKSVLVDSTKAANATTKAMKETPLQ